MIFYLTIFYVIASLFFLAYSFTQVDLSLTLTSTSVWQVMQKSLQYVGYYERGWSTASYIFLISLFYILYICTLILVKRGTITLPSLWRLVCIIAGILVWSYPAFSYDFFNYMFSAKTIFVYHRNPYEVIPLQFAGVEPWLSFLRWTHLPSAYSPLWIVLSLAPYALGFGYFLMIMWNIKLMLAGFYLLTVWGIQKILESVDNKRVALGVAIFALNPLVLVESIVSPHNDIVMMACAVLAFYLFTKKRLGFSYLLLALSAAFKTMTVFLYPVALFFRWNRKYALFAMGGALVFGFFKKELFPWYLLWVMPFVALYPEKEVVLLAIGMSFGLMIRYVPYLYFGHYNDPVPMLQFYLPLLFGGISLLCAGIGVFASKKDR